ncbi:MAG: prolyl oligopeptidase family serine peptidase, partial [Bacteroidales bacterium]|nr:prolyl oligopeptidase family serine peptidase [Bacteroidales bacterium]
MSKKLLSIAAAFFILIASDAQEALKYQLPPDEIVRIVDAAPAPSVSVSPGGKHMIIIERPGLITISELSAEELRLAGLRIDPAISAPSRQTYNRSFSITSIDGTGRREIAGLPAGAVLGFPEWSPDGSAFLFTNRTATGMELWVCRVADLSVAKIAGSLNMVFGNPAAWLPDNRSILFLVSDPGRGKRPEKSRVPAGPVVQENLGKKGQVATYQDLLADPSDEMIFEYFATSQLMLWNGSSAVPLGQPAMISGFDPSPDGRYIMVSQIKRPFSYLVPYNSFPASTQIWDIAGNIIRTLHERPLIENYPRDYDAVLPGPRFFSWRTDKPAVMCWVEALDEGNYRNEMQYHDQVYTLSAPFAGEPEKLIATGKRFSGITWGRDDLAVISEGLSKTRVRVVSTFNPSDGSKPVKKIFEYNSDDGYNNPGRFVTDANLYGKNVLLFADRGKSLFLSGQGASPEGDRPFLDRYDIATGKTTRLWRSEAPYYETIASYLDISRGLLLTSRQSVTEVPNYFIRDTRKGTLMQVTRFENPYPQLAGVKKELVRYKRNDSIDLSFTLYLPAGYERQKDGPLPTLLWAYPREFNDAGAAGQVTGSPYTFTRISAASALVYVTQGYAVLMDASFPIVGVEGKEPNDTFIEQLVADAEAAVDKAVAMGVADRNRVAVSGHSYGAFMTANLLANSRLFAAGIAESGAYNRTLTPFGFQNERRSYWDAPGVYDRMSPFMQADKVKDPLMLIHGMADNNSGTFPVQSERFYAALKGFGATTRLVLLPYESHGYAARETILHKHWEVLKWMDTYVKNRITLK